MKQGGTLDELEHGISDSWATAPEPIQLWSRKRWVQRTCDAQIGMGVRCQAGQKE